MPVGLIWLVTNVILSVAMVKRKIYPQFPQLSTSMTVLLTILLLFIDTICLIPMGVGHNI